ncbi:MAG: hypothetical protein SGJ10_13420 [Bacteroidota bacterium]|nr:hypothetical protein [Bacteroidota bacterium]
MKITTFIIYIKKFSMLLMMLMLLPTLGLSQGNDEQMANQYYINGEFDKATIVYESLIGTNPSSPFIYERLMDCYLKTKKVDQAEILAKKQSKRYEINPQFKVDIYWLQQLQAKKDKGNKSLEKLLKGIAPVKFEYEKTAEAFIKRKLYNEAFKVYEKGRSELNDKGLFSMDLGLLYSITGQKEKMFQEYLDALENDISQMETVQGNLQQYMADSADANLFKNVLNKKVQEKAGYEQFLEMLVWFAVQQHDFMGAFIQVRAIDKKQNLYGNRVMQLAHIARDNKAYAAAGAMLQYVVSLGKELPNYYNARELLIDIRYRQINSGNFDKGDIIIFEKECVDYIRAEGANNYTMNTVKLLAELEAYYLNNPDTAIQLLTTLLETQRLPAKFAADCKLMLGDINILIGEYYVPVLLYGQVDKDFTEDALGQEAKYRNAKLSYYKGDFAWAQSQLEVLKSATSQLISNNAIELSLLIQDNTGLDSTEDAMKMYAAAELLIFQNKFDEANKKLDSIYTIFPQHSLSDEILYAKAKMFRKEHKWTECLENLDKVFTVFKFDILADNALFDAAEIHENNLNDKPKAQELYEKLFNDYPGSVFSVEARKRFRQLRGDVMN